MKEDRVWVAWERHRRSVEMSDALEARLEIMEYQGNRFARWVVLSCRTLRLLCRRRPKTLFVQNPSLVLSLLAVCANRLLGYNLIVDAHTAGIFPLNGRHALLNAISRLVQREADITIVTTTNLGRVVQENGGRPEVLLDRIPGFPEQRPVNLAGSFNVVYVCTYSQDEPFMEVLEAGKLLPGDVFTYVTGNTRKLRGRLSPPDNVVLTGFLPEDEYLALLSSSDVVLVLTTREDCVLCGAYEAMAFQKPLILSRTAALREAFGDGPVYTENDRGSIADAIRLVRGHRAVYASKIAAAKERFEGEWRQSFRLLKSRMENLEDVGT